MKRFNLIFRLLMCNCKFKYDENGIKMNSNASSINTINHFKMTHIYRVRWCAGVYLKNDWPINWSSTSFYKRSYTPPTPPQIISAIRFLLDKYHTTNITYPSDGFFFLCLPFSHSFPFYFLVMHIYAFPPHMP